MLINSIYITKEYERYLVIEDTKTGRTHRKSQQRVPAGTLKQLLYFQFHLQFSDIGSSHIPC